LAKNKGKGKFVPVL